MKPNQQRPNRKHWTSPDAIALAHAVWRNNKVDAYVKACWDPKRSLCKSQAFADGIFYLNEGA